MNIIAWIVFGAIAGWIASLIMGTNDRQGCLLNVIVGIVGALIGGLIMQFLTGTPFDFRFNLPSLLVAIGGAVVLLFIAGLVRRRA